MSIISPTHTLIYSIEKAIKSYRKMAIKRIQTIDKHLTVDQTLILMLIDLNSDISQVAIAEDLFKDYASITRMIDNLIGKEYLLRESHESDKRKHHLVITKKGKTILEELKPVISQNREEAMDQFTKAELLQFSAFLNRFINNCNSTLPKS